MMTEIPFITTEQMRQVDRAMIEDFHIELIQMMENAGRSLAHLARTRFLDEVARERSVFILAGTGGNGGGGLACARHLHNWGAQATVVTTKPDDQYVGVPAHQLQILRNMEVPVITAGALKNRDEQGNFDLVVDAIIGYSLAGTPRGAAAKLIAWADRQKAPVLSLDTPSGLDPTSGKVFNPTIRAAATMTLALPKLGFRQPQAREVIGELYLADISVPPGLYASLGIELPAHNLFAKGEITRIW